MGHVKSHIVGLPITIMDRYRTTTLCIDNMFVNQVEFFMSISRDLHFITAEAFTNRQKANLALCLTNVYRAYLQRGFKIAVIHGDSEFECLREIITSDLKATLNIAGKGEHVPEIERGIRTVKERTRCTYNTTRFDKFPPKMIMGMVFLSVFWLNAFPNKHKISTTLSPRTIVTRCHIDYTIHCKIEYGQYVQTHEKHDNTMDTRTVGALALRPTDNAQGGYYFYSLASGIRLHRTHWTALPMSEAVKDRVHALARRASADKGLTLTDSDGRDLDTIFPEDDEVCCYDPSDDEQSYDSDKDSNYDSSDSDSDTDGGPVHLPIVPPAGDADDRHNTGVDDDEYIEEKESDDENAGVDNAGNSGPTGVDDLEEFVEGLEAKLDD
jgi:hypothetical protein